MPPGGGQKTQKQNKELLKIPIPMGRQNCQIHNDTISMVYSQSRFLHFYSYFQNYEFTIKTIYKTQQVISILISYQHKPQEREYQQSHKAQNRNMHAKES